MAEMGVYEAMRTLRAVRRLKPDPIPNDVLHRVLEAATWAPTGGNRQPWRIIAVKDREKKNRLGAWYSERWAVFSKGYRSAIPADMPEDGKKRMLRTIAAGDYLAQHWGETPVVAIFCFNPKEMAITDSKLDRPSVVGGGSVYPAVENLLIACRAEGLGCVLTTLLCAMEPQVKELLAIPEGWGTCAAIPIGYPVGRGHGPIIRHAATEMTYLDSWGNRLA
jgi:nitroreductase